MSKEPIWLGISLRPGDGWEQLGLRHNITTRGILGRLSDGQNPWQRCPCYIGWYQTWIRCDGGVMPCCRCNLLVGDLNRASFTEIWDSPPYQDFRIRSRTSDAMRYLPGTCRCDWCCFMPQNLRIRRIVKWFGPLRRRTPRDRAADSVLPRPRRRSPRPTFPNQPPCCFSLLY